MKWELDAFCEIDRYAVDSYCEIHKVNPVYNLGDITAVDLKMLPKSTMVCGGSPCTDFSVAGKGAGSTYECVTCRHKWNPLTVHFTKRDTCPQCGSRMIEGTRSSLVVHFLSVIRNVKPKFGLFENVKALTNKKHRDTFELFLKELQEYGYNTYWKVLNAKDFGIPQNRERVIVVFTRKDVDNGKFQFPEGFGCENPVLALMKEDMPEKSSDEVNQCGYVDKNSEWNRIYDSSGCGKALKAQGGGMGQKTGAYLVQSGYMYDNADANRVYDSRGVARSLKAEAGGGGAKTGWYLLNPEPDGTCRTIKANYAKSSMANWKNPKDRGTTGVACLAAVRKLTPKECFRLMGFDDADYEAAKGAGISNSQLYKQCGNSIVVDMLYYIMKSLRTANPSLFDDLHLLSLFSGIGAFEKALDKLGGPMEHDWDWEAWERMQSEEDDGIAVFVRNGNRHTPGAKSEQRVESEGKRVANTISTVEKDSMVMEVKKR